MADRRDNAKQNEIRQLFEAVSRGAIHEVEDMLSKGVSVDIRDTMERTPLMAAAEAGLTDLVKKLLDHGADVNAVDVDGETPLMAATYSGHPEVLKLLVPNGADLDLRNKEGSTALEIAQDMGVSAVVTYLAAQSASSAIRSSEEKSTDSNDEERVTDGPAAAEATAPTAESPNIQLLGRNLGHALVQEPARSTYFKPGRTGGTDEAPPEEAAEDEGMGTEMPAAEPQSDDVAIAHDSDRKANRQPEVLLPQASAETRPKKVPLADVLPETEERIVFDAWDNRQVKSVNKKATETLDKAGLEFGGHSTDTVFKGNYMAVLNPRSKEFKRFRKLWKHPELMIDPRRWAEWTGAAAVRRYCLAEGIDVSSLRGSHFVELYYLKDRDLILAMAEKANSHNYTVRELKQAIGDLKEERDDLDAGKAIIRTLDQSLPLLDEPELVSLCSDKERLLQELSKAERKKIRNLLKKRKSGLNEWRKLLETLEGILNDLDE